ncbi:hypothetical protein [Haladaptatus sp. DYSN1]|uniref:hypothetical protein n=1 Tax=unclassified Haladaptatus TaxID=2622732 RepID=UPI002407710F|nr:hypothetical protein [Haladaptatus sp. DYSN1]
MAIPIRPSGAVVGAVVLLIIVSFTVGLTGFGGPSTPDQDLVFDDVDTQTPTPVPTTTEPRTTQPAPTTTTVESHTTTSVETERPPEPTTTQTWTKTVKKNPARKTTTETPATTTPVTTTPERTTERPPATETPPAVTPTPDEPLFPYQVYFATGRGIQQFDHDRGHTFTDQQRLVAAYRGNTHDGVTRTESDTAWQSEHIRECVVVDRVEQERRDGQEYVTVRFHIEPGCERTYYSLTLYQWPHLEALPMESEALEFKDTDYRKFGPGHHILSVKVDKRVPPRPPEEEPVTHWQVYVATGPEIEQFDPDNGVTYSDQRRVIQSFRGQSQEGLALDIEPIPTEPAWQSDYIRECIVIDRIVDEGLPEEVNLFVFFTIQDGCAPTTISISYYEMPDGGPGPMESDELVLVRANPAGGQVLGPGKQIVLITVAET